MGVFQRNSTSMEIRGIPNSSSEDAASRAWIDGCTKWIETGLYEGKDAYYVNFMFHPLGYTKRRDTLERMRSAIAGRFYGQLCTRFTADPRAPSQQDRLPAFFLFPDLPVPKRGRATLQDVTINGGLHYQGPMLAGPMRRQGRRVDDFIREAQADLCVKGIMRIDIKPIDRTLRRLASYAVKAIERGWVDADEILILPRHVGELKIARSSDPNSPKRQLQDLQSAFHLSDETALRLWQAR